MDETDWLVEASRLYWEGEIEKAKNLYEENRPGFWADAEEWERNLWREEASEYVE
jgi:hypothetical protein